MTRTDQLAIEFICGMAMPPADFVRLAHGLGVSRVGLAPAPITANPHNFSGWDLRTDAAMLAKTEAALAETGISVAQGEGFLIMPGTRIADSEPALDLFARLGAPIINAVIIEQDRTRAVEEFAALAAMAETRGIVVTLEFMPLMWPASLTDAVDFLARTGAANGKLMIDAMHLYRSGSTTADLAAIDPTLIGYAQLCDVPLHGIVVPPPPEAIPAYGEEARHERLCPGDGDLPLAGFIAAVPHGVTIGLEIPQMAKALTGMAPIEALRPCVDAARNLIRQNAAERSGR